MKQFESWQSYIDDYLEKGSWYKVIKFKDWYFKEPINLIFISAAALFFLLGIAVMSWTALAAARYMIFGVLFFISLALVYAALSSYLRKVLVGYEKDGIRFWEYVLMPQQLQKTIPLPTLYQDGEKNIFLNVVLKKPGEYTTYNPFGIDKSYVSPQKLTAIQEQSSLSRYSRHSGKTTAQEMIQKGTIFLILGGEGFLIYIMMTNILSKV